MVELSRLSGCGGVSCSTVIFISFYAINERILAQNEMLYGAHNPNNYPLINSSWCLDLEKCCIVEMRSVEYTKMLLDFCLDQHYGFMGLRDLGIDEEQEKEDFIGPREYTNEQIDRIMEAVIDAWAQNNDTKKAFLKNPLFYCPDKEENRCYWRVYKAFALMCLDPLYNMHARLYKNIFVHICEADWLDLRTIASLTKSTCVKKMDIMSGSVTSSAA